jgi:hypothetical protein
MNLKNVQNFRSPPKTRVVSSYIFFVNTDAVRISPRHRFTEKEPLSLQRTTELGEGCRLGKYHAEVLEYFKGMKRIFPEQ